MTRYSLHKIDAIEGKQQFYKLGIDNKCQFDEYEEEIENNGQYEEELASIYANMEDVANNKLLPNTKFKDITKGKSKVKEYEFKTKHLRVYAIKHPDGKLIIFGGYKNQQKKDIRKFRSIKNAYLKTYYDEKGKTNKK
ncbi:MAG TPA: hypothetical protein VJ937_09625 [Salinivirga sp.]|uniref:hypothetical protein n=1 Tax=Salinivirga sp. TaxID=1970192 RepID=UPI002B47F2D6|nr:hypothetical protein [Salinivirga sp.]HKK59727.1 hypothetical protein [Salinivirga sp.]